MTNPVFVYGTLKQGYGLHGCLRGQEFLGAAKMKGFSMYSLGGYPCIVRDDPNGEVHGECYLVDDETLRRLDRIELGAGYDRENHMTTEGKLFGVYVWQEPPYNADPIEGGCWIGRNRA